MERKRRNVNKRAAGAAYEQRAADLLERQGYVILERNYRCRQGEIDLVARHGEYLVFIEVKYRRDESSGCGLEAVDMRKQKRIQKAVLWYMASHGVPDDQPCRFDVVSFLGSEATLLQDAFWCG